MEAIKLVSRRNFLKGSAVVGGLLAAGGFWRAIDAGVFNSGKASLIQLGIQVLKGWKKLCVRQR
ncbi:twin-arginine translocation signal domain-containing protein [Bacillus cytotoxicus]|uniref:twin-arginine translocation signal domain-containing protein n=1 Tax=Bacillus cytotoxicus TaxID=580165 RepID=UPI000B966B73|nr:hypothetical protein CG474_017310 [Bacillus cytotoxicus]